jgi:hypothetical protein
MSQSLGKKNFSKKGLIAICLFNEMFSAATVKGPIQSLVPIIEEAKERAATSELLLLKRPELEAKAKESIGTNSSWGTYSTFSSTFFKKSC